MVMEEAQDRSGPLLRELDWRMGIARSMPQYPMPGRSVANGKAARIRMETTL